MKENERYLLMHKYLSGQATAREKEELDSWLARDPEHKEIFNEVKLIWDVEDFGGEEPQHDPEGLARLQARIDQSMAEGERRHPGKYVGALKIAISVLLLIGFGFSAGLLVDSFTDSPLKIITDLHHSKISLPDGSSVYLNENSSLIYKDSLGNRIAFLKGEAWFEVSKDENSPFFIYMEDASIKVLGTSFNVKAYEERDIEVVVSAGTVVFSYGPQHVNLEVGEKGVLDRQQERMSKTENQDPNFDAWKTGKLQFRNTRLDVILKTLENYYDVSFNVKDKNMLTCRFTGTFKDERVEVVLEVLAFALNLSYHYTGEAYSISGNGCNQ